MRLDGEYHRPYEEDPCAWAFESRMIYVDVLCRVVPSISTLSVAISGVADASIDAIIKTWADNYCLEPWLVEYLIVEMGVGGKRISAWFEGRNQQPDLTEFLENPDAIHTVTIMGPHGCNVEPFRIRYGGFDLSTVTLDELRTTAKKLFHKRWKEYESAIREKAAREGWVRSTAKKRTRERGLPERHFAWVARYQSGGESYRKIAASPNTGLVQRQGAKPFKGREEVSLLAVRKAVRGMARRIGISLRHPTKGSESM